MASPHNYNGWTDKKNDTETLNYTKEEDWDEIGIRDQKVTSTTIELATTNDVYKIDPNLKSGTRNQNWRTLRRDYSACNFRRRRNNDLGAMIIVHGQTDLIVVPIPLRRFPNSTSSLNTTSTSKSLIYTEGKDLTFWFPVKMVGTYEIETSVD